MTTSAHTNGTLAGKTIVIAGGTGNVGPFIATALLKQGVTVVVPSRSQTKLDELREHLRQHVGAADLRRLETLVADLGDEADAAALRRLVTDTAGTPSGVVAANGDFVTTPTLLQAGADQLRRALDGYLIAHFQVARTFLPVLKDTGGTFVMLQGPLAFELTPGLGSDLVSVATAGQHMLFRALAKEIEGTRARAVELVVHALIRDRQTQPQSPLPGEAVGGYVAHLLSGAGEVVSGQSISLRSPEQLAAAELDIRES